MTVENAGEAATDLDDGHPLVELVLALVGMWAVAVLPLFYSWNVRHTATLLTDRFVLSETALDWVGAAPDRYPQAGLMVLGALVAVAAAALRTRYPADVPTTVVLPGFVLLAIGPIWQLIDGGNRTTPDAITSAVPGPGLVVALGVGLVGTLVCLLDRPTVHAWLASESLRR